MREGKKLLTSLKMLLKMSEEMQKHEYAKLAKNDSFYFWNIGRKEILKEALLRHIGPRDDLEILDMGCGPGGNISLLSQFGRVTGLDVSEEALKFARSYSFFKLVLADAKKLPFTDSSYDLVTSLDVFEHLEDDQKAFREVWRVLRQGGVLLTTVPAHPWLWSPHDEALFHKRRYTRSELLKRISEAGFTILGCSNFVSLGVPINFLRKTRDGILRKVFPEKNRVVENYDIEFPKVINSLLLSFLRLERFIIRFISLPFGTSIFVVAKKL